MLFRKKTITKVDNNKEINLEYISKEQLTACINNITEGKRSHFDENEIGCRELTDLLNKMLDGFYEDKINILSQVNSLLKYITEMDFVKDMIKDVRNQTSTFNNIAANSEEMAASIEDISNFIENVTHRTKDLTQIAENGSEHMNKALSFVQNSFKDIENISLQMKNVMKKTEKINEIVDVVKGIADQTNLLALNAAIEAARAGEHGRGFVVVSTEVKKLSEYTKESVSNIEANINELKLNIGESVSKIENTTSHLDMGKNLVNNAMKSMESIIGSIEEINSNVIQVSCNVEEQTAATSEIAVEMNGANEKADKLLKECDNTGKAICGTSNIVNDIRINILDSITELKEKDMIDICIVDHLIWKWRVYNMILGYDSIDIHTIGDHKQCRLGKWYDSRPELKENEIFKSLDKPHVKLHQLGKEAAIAYGRKDMAAAERALAEMDECSNEVVGILRKIKKIL